MSQATEREITVCATLVGSLNVGKMLMLLCFFLKKRTEIMTNRANLDQNVSYKEFKYRLDKLTNAILHSCFPSYNYYD